MPMRIPWSKGLRWQILGNLTVAMVFASLLAGMGVWFINGKEMVRWNMFHGNALFQSLTREILSIDNGADSRSLFSDMRHIDRIKGLVDTYHHYYNWAQLLVVDDQFRVKACAGGFPENSGVHDEMLLRALSERKQYSELDGGGIVGMPLRLKVATALIKDEEVIGGILGYFSLGTIAESVRSTQKFIFIYMALITLVMLVFGTILLSRTIVHPLEKMNAVIANMTAGDLDQAVAITENNEIGKLGEAFNTMADRLRQHQRALKDHVLALQRANRDLKQSQEEVVHSEKLASIGLLAAGVAHEIGNPLSSILGYVGILQRGLESAHERRDYLDRIENEVTRINTIVQGLRHYATTPHPEKGPLDVHKIITETISMLSSQCAFSDIRFETFLESDVPLVAVDESQFQQVLINLFLNANDAMHGKGIVEVYSRRTSYEAHHGPDIGDEPRRKDDPPDIDFYPLRKHSASSNERFTHGQPLLEITIRDHGEGIAENVLRKVFDPFFTTKETGKGTGLGLTICQRIMESLGGSISLETEPGNGCTARLLLPIDRV